MSFKSNSVQSDTHGKWESWTTEEINWYLEKYGNARSLGKRSSSRRKKLNKLQSILIQREQVVRLLTFN